MIFDDFKLRQDFREKIEKSSIGEAQREIEELGLDHHLLHLAEELKKPRARRPCPKCGKTFA